VYDIVLLIVFQLVWIILQITLLFNVSNVLIFLRKRVLTFSNFCDEHLWSVRVTNNQILEIIMLAFVYFSGLR